MEGDAGSIPASRLCGELVVRVAIARHSPTGELHGVWIERGGGGGYAIRGRKEGWGVVVDESPLQAVGLGRYGQVEVVPAPEHLDGSAATITDVAELVSPEADEPFGLRLSLSNGRTLFVYDQDDQFHVRDRLGPWWGETDTRPVCGEGDC